MGAKRCAGRFTAWLLRKVTFVVDRFHWKNHKDEKFCKKMVDPKKCKLLHDQTNTEAAEQVSPDGRLHSHIPCARTPLRPPVCATCRSQSFSWLAESKHLFKNMNEGRHLFLLLRMMELRNQHLIRRRRLPSSTACTDGGLQEVPNAEDALYQRLAAGN